MIRFANRIEKNIRITKYDKFLIRSASGTDSSIIHGKSTGLVRPEDEINRIDIAIDRNDSWIEMLGRIKVPPQTDGDINALNSFSTMGKHIINGESSHPIQNMVAIVDGLMEKVQGNDLTAHDFSKYENDMRALKESIKSSMQWLQSSNSNLKSRKEQLQSANGINQGDLDYKKYQKSIEKQKIFLENEMQKNSLSDRDLYLTNFTALKQTEAFNITKHFCKGKIKGEVTISAVVEPNFSVNWSISSFKGDGSLDSVRKPLTDALHMLDVDFVSQIKKYMRMHDRRFDSTISSVIWNFRI
jgi:hypothetical protein